MAHASEQPSSEPASPVLPEEPDRFLVRAITLSHLQLEEALLHYRETPSGEPLHDLRVALRRTTALANLLEDFPEKGDGLAIRKRARRLRRKLSPARQREVSAELLPKLAGRGKRLSALAAALASTWIADQAQESPEKTTHATERLLSRLLDWQKRASAWNPGARELSRLARKVTARIDERRERLLSHGVPTTATLHASRIDGKGLRYQLEIVSEAVPEAAALVRALKPFQTSLGDAHDLISLETDVLQAARELALRKIPEKGVPETAPRAAVAPVQPLLLQQLVTRVRVSKRLKIAAARRAARTFLSILRTSEPTLRLEKESLRSGRQARARAGRHPESERVPNRPV